jgi:hypothetical protein
MSLVEYLLPRVKGELEGLDTCSHSTYYHSFLLCSVNQIIVGAAAILQLSHVVAGIASACAFDTSCLMMIQGTTVLPITDSLVQTVK